MNQKLFLIILTMLLNLFAGCTHAKPVPDSPIAFMEYRVDNATRYPTLHFIFRRDDDGRYWLTNASNCDPELAHAIEVPASFAEQLKQIVVEERMLAYKEHYIYHGCTVIYAAVICGALTSLWKTPLPSLLQAT